MAVLRRPLCVLPGVLAASPCVTCWQGAAGHPGDMQGNGKAAEKVRCCLLGRSVGGLFRAVFLALDFEDFPLAPFCGQGLHSKPTHTLSTLSFPAHFRAFGRGNFRCCECHSSSA